MKKNLIIFFIFYALIGRENPFEPVVNPKDSSENSIQDSKGYFEAFDFKLPTTARILKSVSVTYQNIDGSIDTKTFNIDKSIDWHYPLSLSQKNALVSEETNYYAIKPFEFFVKDNKLYIHSAENIQRSFVLPTPYRIIIDIDRKTQNINQSIDISKKYYSKISIGTHQNFYRIVITLDGQYRYKIDKEDEYYIISVK
ncbi:AMIN domain-containing protein [Helicobacter cappadocius]|uniref:AMIN domain-containing protein n=1 Tax=Helicobacter cappadocius TaxID=3063998 RepID=A0AA90TFH1_9HELI|nr:MULTISPECIES: AMIN domain-containing protein [unclassified Helicobacter]MDO7253682.1 AMIN domain-containing protein [Helicobacter sp. faydin-H75]MDP2539630.1 AMIN domain-containing protein [Helicobacter sp. faydin-H76]